jgi:hypothetical protein
MDTPYHISVLTETLGSQISARALQTIIAGNLGQDRGRDQFKPHVHFDNSLFTEGLAFMEAQHAIIARSNEASEMWLAFGKLTHAAQDFYSHSNYVDLWLEANGGFEKTKPEDINGLDEKLLADSRLVSGNFFLWRDIIYYIPLLKNFAKKHWVFPDSHEAMNLDVPECGAQFPYSIVAAKQRTRAEYDRVMKTLSPQRAAMFRDIVELKTFKV